MSTSRRTFLQTTAAAFAPAAPSGHLDASTIARRHTMTRDLPTPDFFEGMLLGNGDIGVCVTARPDALGIHIGKLDVWDIRVSEDHVRHLLPFREVLKLWEEAGERAKRDGKPDAIYLETTDPVLREYVAKVRTSYAKPWPRPWPCGVLWAHWDSRLVRIRRQTLDPSVGLYRIEFDGDNLRGRLRPAWLECFVSWSSGHIALYGDAPVLSLAYYPHVDREAQMPPPEINAGSSGEFTCLQRLPATAPSDAVPEPPPSPQDRTFALCGRLHGDSSAAPLQTAGPGVLFRRRGRDHFRLDVTLLTSLDDPDPRARAGAELRGLAAAPAEDLRKAAAGAWREFWSRSAVEFEDRELERIWYHNQYFLACTLREGKVAPGLFGNWSSGNIGTAWHGDYHMNYNTQQVFWGVFSSNHVGQHLPYVDLVEKLIPMAEWNAREQFGLPGAYFPHSAYPVPSQVNPYPVPPWGYEICETPWTVQSLWWHYLYTLDEGFLRRAYPLLKAAADFLVAYARKESDGKYHLNPTVSPENWGLTVDQRLNRDCIIDIALAEFLLDAMIEAARLLGRDASERARWQEIRDNLAPYPVVDGPHGRVWLDVAGAPAEHVYNVPVTLSPVFPADQVGLDRRSDLVDLAGRSARTVRLEGGNDLVWQPLVRARLGMLDLDWFKREVRYCLLPSGVANDRVRQIGGRYSDRTNFDFMMRMGVWTENLSLPAVLNECMLQSCAGVIRLFPNTMNLGPARFENLRAAGAFLVSAAWDGAAVRDVRLFSEKGAPARVISPWPRARLTSQGGELEFQTAGPELRFPTAPGHLYELSSA